MFSLKRRLDLGLQRGFSLIEVLIAIVILSFGLLGLAALQAKVHGAGMEAVQRSQALVILEDMVARINANHADAASYVKSGLGITAIEDCAGTAKRDLCEWSDILKAESNPGGLMGAQGCIEQVRAGPPLTLRVTVAWQGLVPTAVPSLGCGAKDYGSDDSLRRVASTLVTIADLSAL